MLIFIHYKDNLDHRFCIVHFYFSLLALKSCRVPWHTSKTKNLMSEEHMSILLCYESHPTILTENFKGIIPPSFFSLNTEWVTSFSYERLKQCKIIECRMQIFPSEYSCCPPEITSIHSLMARPIYLHMCICKFEHLFIKTQSCSIYCPETHFLNDMSKTVLKIAYFILF
jgi:hypothetical protein